MSNCMVNSMSDVVHQFRLLVYYAILLMTKHISEKEVLFSMPCKTYSSASPTNTADRPTSMFRASALPSKQQVETEQNGRCPNYLIYYQIGNRSLRPKVVSHTVVSPTPQSRFAQIRSCFAHNWNWFQSKFNTECGKVWMLIDLFRCIQTCMY